MQQFVQQLAQKRDRNSIEGSIRGLCSSGSREYGPGEKRDL